MENADSLLQSIGAILAILLSGFAMFKVHRSTQEDKEADKAIEQMADHAHRIIKVEAEEDHAEVAEALDESDASAAIADLFNDRKD
jgi:ABC-type nickel/cobalt efflux system permease component RcnA|tara:strand:- start:266 stop:523 length:258 start_codon:yes stop_codon:yes gene_type:complete